MKWQLLHKACRAVHSTVLDMTPYEQAMFCGLAPAAELLRGFRAAAPHPTGMSELWLLAASRLSEGAKWEALRAMKIAQVNLSWRKATPLDVARRWKKTAAAKLL
ncbi:MAG: hypothetical protein U0R19_04230 [Bryobacteraceae bacterium]